MTNMLNAYFENAQLSFAAYAPNLMQGIAPDAYVEALKTAGMATKQAEAFASGYTVLSQSAPNANGFSATLFQNNATGQKILAIRGTDDLFDGLTDVVSVALLGTTALQLQYQSLKSYYQQLITEGKLGAAETFSVTGHSLGGFLAQSFAVDYADKVSQTYTYNAPGIGGVVADVLNALGVTATNISVANITNIIAQPGLSATAGLGTMLGNVNNVFIEQQTNPFNNHKIGFLSDSLAFQALLASIDGALSVDAMNKIQKALSAKMADSLEKGVEAIYKLFKGTSVSVGIDNREDYYSKLFDVKSTIDEVAAIGGLQLKSLVDAAGLADLAKSDIAYRYALRELNPFAVLGAGYSRFNQAGELDLYDPESGQGRLSDQWLADRAAFLARKIEYNSADGVGSVIAGADSYLDARTNFALSPILVVNRIVFGDDSGKPISGGSGNDHLYGGAGADTLTGNGGADYLEGGAGEDKLYGGEGNDTLVGQAGNDLLDGGKGVDQMLGGLDDDTYIVDDPGDTVVEKADQGTDLVKASITYTLPDNVENLTLTGAEAIDGAGNGLANKLTGNAANNVLKGLDGADTLIGGAGSDQLFGGAGDDTLYGDGQAEDDTSFAGNDVLRGGAGKDKLYGGAGADELYGGADDDLLRGGKGNDDLYGGTGFDTYYYKSGDGVDTIFDLEEQAGNAGAPHQLGEIQFDDATLTGGKRKTQGEWRWVSADGRFVYTADGDPQAGPVTLKINGVITVKDFQNDDLSIHLEDDHPGQPQRPPQPTADVPRARRGDPLIVDLAGGGIQTVGLAAQLHFDHDGDGMKEATGWAAPGSGLLVLDRNGDGALNNGAELFGNFTPTNGGMLAVNGFQALSQFDRNGDGVIDATDPIWSQLRVWQYDTDPQGHPVIADPDLSGRLTPLDELGITAINLGSAITNATDGSGNTQTRLGSFTKADGTRGQVGEYRLVTDGADTVPVTRLGVEADLQALPELNGSGQVLDLHQALQAERNAGGTQLKELLDAFDAETDPTHYYSRFESVLFKWAGVDNVTPTNLGGDFDARKLAVLNKFYGEALPKPDYWQAVAWDKTYKDLAEGLYATLLSRTHYASLYDSIDATLEAAGNTRGHLAPVIATLAAELATDPAKGRADVIEFGRSIRGLGLQDTLDYLNLRETFVGNDPDFAFEFDSAGIPKVPNGGVGHGYNDFSEATKEDTVSLNLYSWNGDDVSYGTAGYDHLVLGSVTPNYNGVLAGLGGNDNLWGGFGADLLDGGPGDDYLRGREGNDTYLMRPGSGHDTIDDEGAASDLDTVFIGGNVQPQEVTLSASNRDLVIRINGSGDSMTVVRQFDADFGDTTNRIERIVFQDGTAWDGNEIWRRSGRSVPSGTEGDDLIIGNAMDNLIQGLGGNDTLYGMSGNDTLDGGAGDDTLIGSIPQLAWGSGTPVGLSDKPNGNDTYIFGRGYGHDTIIDSDPDPANVDRILLKPDLTPQEVRLRRAGDDLVLSIPDTGESLTVSGQFRRRWNTSTFEWEQDPTRQVEQIQFADGTRWDVAQIERQALTGGPGDDTLVGFADSNLIQGLDGNDTLIGDRFDDTLLGGGGDDALDGNGGDDRLDGGEGNDNLWGGEGDDLLIGAAGNDTLIGGAGNDTIDGGAGDDLLNGPDNRYGSRHGFNYAPGNDTYIFGFDYGHDLISDYDPTPGNTDTVRFKDGVAPSDVRVSRKDEDLVVALASSGEDGLSVANWFYQPRYGSNAASKIERFEFSDGTVWDIPYIEANLQLQGTPGDDRIEGTESGETIDALPGNDTVLGQGGDDTLLGAEGDDALFGGAGNDRLNGGEGNDQLYGEAGDDTIDGGAGNDILFGGEGDDTLAGGAGDDTLIGGDTTAENLSFWETSDSGSDTYRFGRGDGHDLIFDQGIGHLSTDRLQLGADIAPGEVKLIRSGEDLLLTLKDAPDTVTVKHWFAQPDVFRAVDYKIERIEFADATMWDPNEVARQVLIGTEGDDSLLGYDSDDSIVGGGGNDTLNGGAGNDTLDGGAGDDILIGGEGGDTYIFGRGYGRDAVFDSASTPENANVVQINADTNPAEVLVRRLGDDAVLTIEATGEQLTIAGQFSESGSANPVERVRFADGTNWDEATLKALAIQGTPGEDTIAGFNDAEVFDGGAGNDTITGGAGNDTYRFGRGSGHDVVIDPNNYNGDSDSIVLAPGLTAADVTLSAVEGNLVLTINDTGESLTALNWFGIDNHSRVNQIAFADGTVWGRDAIQALTDHPSDASLIIGTPGNDVLNGNPSDNVMIGQAGDDLINGGAGNDDIEGDDGNDTLLGGDGQDTLLGGAGDDFIKGGPGRDTLDGGAGNDTFSLGIGDGLDFVLYDGASKGLRSGFEDFDSEARNELTQLSALPDDAWYRTSFWSNLFSGEATAGIPDEVRYPLVGLGGDGSSKRDAEAALQALEGWLNQVPDGLERVYGEGAVELEEVRALPDDAWYANNFWRPDDGGPLYRLPEDIRQSLFALSVEGSSKSDALAALQALMAWLNPDPAGQDTIEFGPGILIDDLDVATDVGAGGYGGSVGGVSHLIAVGVHGTDDGFLIDPLAVRGHGGGIDAKTISIRRFVFADGTTTTLDDILARNDGGLVGRQFGTAGDDLLKGSAADDTIYGGGGNDRILARGNNDHVDGGDGDDIIDAGSGQDTVYGGAGDDIIAGGKGGDELHGDAGSNVYVFNRGDGNDVIFNNAPASPGDMDTLSLGVGITPSDLSAYVNGNGDLVLLVDGAAGGSIRTPWFDVGGQISEIDHPGIALLQFIDAEGHVRIFDFAGMVHAATASLITADASAPVSLFDTAASAFELTGTVVPAGGVHAVAYAQTGDLFAQPYYGRWNQPSSGDDMLVASDAGDAINAGTGNDIIAGGAGSDSIDGGDGNDLIDGGAGDDVLIGGAGDDTLKGGAGNDQIDAGTGTNFVAGGSGDDTYYFNAGDGTLTIDDIADASGGNKLVFGAEIDPNALRLSYQGSELIIDTGTQGDRIKLSNFNAANPDDGYAVQTYQFADATVLTYGDLLSRGFDLAGTDAADVIVGTSRQDRVVGGEGDDRIAGGRGDDVLDGGNGDDTYFFNSGDGHDTLIDLAGPGAGNTIQFGDGIDPASVYLTLENNALVVHYGNQGDSISLSVLNPDDPSSLAPVQTIRFADGAAWDYNQLLSLGWEIDGTPGDDSITGTGRDDTIVGFAGKDTLAGGAGSDTYVMHEGDGIDTIADTAGAGEENTVEFTQSWLTPDNLRLDYDATDGTLNLHAGSDEIRLKGFDPGDPLGTHAVGLFQFDGAGQVIPYAGLIAHGFDIQGTDGNDTLQGTAAHDRIEGGLGDDFIAGGPGNDVVAGGQGDDTYLFNRGDGVLTIDDSADATGGNTLQFGPGITLADMEQSLSFVPPANGDSGTFIIRLGNTGDEIRMAGLDPTDVQASPHAIDTFRFADGSLVNFNNLVRNTFIVQGDTGDDYLTGTNITDRLYGYEGNDELHGGDGGDTLTGGPDDDQLFGEGGDDLYVFNRGDGVDTIHDVSTLTEGNGILFGPGISRGDLELVREPNLLRIRYGAGDEIRLADFDPTGINGSTVVSNITFADGTMLSMAELLDRAPVAVDTIPDQQVLQDQSLTFQMPASAFADPDAGDTLTYTAERADGAALPSWLSFDAATRTFSGTPENVDVGSFGIQVTATDALGASAAQTFNLEVVNVNDPPVAGDDEFSIGEDDGAMTLAATALLANDTDIDVGDSKTIVAVSGQSAAGATVTLLPADPAQGLGQQVVYDPGTLFQRLQAGEIATDTFTYTLADAAGAASSATVTVSITGANDAPVTVDDSANVSEDSVTTATGNVLANDSDVDAGTVLNVAAPGTFAGTYGTLTLGADGGYAYSLDNSSAVVQSLAQGQIVTDSFAYAASDGIANTPAQLSVSINGMNDAPVAHDDTGAAQEDGGPVTLPAAQLLANDTDVDAGDTQTLVSVSAVSAAGAAVRLVPADPTQGLGPRVEYDPGGLFQSLGAGETTTDTFTYTLADGAGATSTATVAMTITGVNDAPTVAHAIAGQVAYEDKLFALPLPTDTFADVDANDTLAFNAQSADGSPLPDWLGFDPASLSFGGTPGFEDVGPFTVAVSATDRAGASAAASFEIAIPRSPAQHLLGTARDDVLYGKNGNDLIAGRAGDDQIFGGAGDDTLVGERGNDTLWGGSGNDLLFGGAGADSLYGGAGNDILEGGNGKDILDGSAGNDLLRGGNGRDVLLGGAGTNVFIGGRGQDAITTSGTNDIILINAHDAGGGEGEGEHDDDHNDGRPRSWGQDDNSRGAWETVIVLPSSAANRLTFSLGEGIRAQDIRFKREGADLNMNLGRGDAVRLQGWYGLGASERPNLTLQVIGSDVRRYTPGAAVNALASGKETKADQWLGAGVIAKDPASGQPQVIGGAIAWSYAKNGSGDALPAEMQQTWLGSADFGRPQTVDPGALPPAGEHHQPGDDSRDHHLGDDPQDHHAGNDHHERNDGHGSESGKHDDKHPPKKSDDADRRLEKLIQSWFDEESPSERLLPLSALDREAVSGREEADAQRSGNRLPRPRDFRSEWARMDDLLTKHLEGAGEAAEFGAQFGSEFKPFSLFHKGNSNAMALSVDDGRHMQVLTGLKEGLVKLS